jgi:hypothetical protein
MAYNTIIEIFPEAAKVELCRNNSDFYLQFIYKLILYKNILVLFPFRLLNFIRQAVKKFEWKVVLFSSNINPFFEAETDGAK